MMFNEGPIIGIPLKGWEMGDCEWISGGHECLLLLISLYLGTLSVAFSAISLLFFLNARQNIIVQ
jgi:hypothetical protein